MAASIRVSGIVLAGGRSSRMGLDKASLILDGVTMLQRCIDRLAPAVDEFVIVGAPDRPLPSIVTDRPWRIALDPIEGEGPLVGIAAGLEVAAGAVAAVVAVDMPFVEATLIGRLIERISEVHRWVLPIAEHRPQPLCSVFAASALTVVRAHLDAGDRAPMALAADLGAYRMQPEEWQLLDPEGRSFINVNTPEEFAALLGGAANSSGRRPGGPADETRAD